MRFSFLLLFIFTSIIGQGQPNIQWQKCFGGSNSEYSSKAIQNSLGDFSIVGGTNSVDGQVTGLHPGLCQFSDCYDIWIVNLDSSGNLLWTETFGGTYDDYAQSVVSSPDGGVLVCGITYSNNGDVSGNHGESDVWLLKLDSSGTLEWQKCYGGSSFEGAKDIISTYDGGYVVIGSSWSIDGDVPGNHRPNPGPGGATADVWIFKLDSAGTIEWSKNYGSLGDDIGFSIVQTFDSGFAFLATSETSGGDVTGGNGYKDYWLGRIDNLGNFLWGDCFGGRGSDEGVDLKQTPDSGFVLIGKTASTDGDISYNHDSIHYDSWLVRTDQLGTLLWEKSIGGTNNDAGNSVILLPDSGFLVCTTAYSTDGDITGSNGSTEILVSKISDSGQILWGKCFGGSGSEDNVDLIASEDGGWLIINESYSNDADVSGNHGGIDFWIAKLFEPSVYEAAIKLKPINGSCTLTDTEEVILQITNLGIHEFSNFQASYSINGGNPVQEIISDTIYPGDTLLYHFITRADFILPGTYTLQANVIVVGDGHAFNDVSTINVTSISHNTVPMIMGFESQEYFGAYKSIDLDGDGRSGSLDLGYPQNGSQCYVFASSFLPNPNNWLWTPCIDLNALTNYKVSGWMKEYEVIQPYNLEIYINQEPDTTGAILLGTVLTPTDSSYHPFQFPFTVSSGGIWYIGLKAYAQNYAQAVFLDDLEIDLYTGIQAQKGIEFYTLYPNPFKDKIYFNQENFLNGEITIFNTLGKLVYTGQLKSRSSIDLSFLNDGIYFLKYNDEKVTHIKKIIKQN